MLGQEFDSCSDGRRPRILLAQVNLDIVDAETFGRPKLCPWGYRVRGYRVKGLQGQVSRFPQLTHVVHHHVPFSYSITTRLTVELDRPNATAMAV